MEFDCFSVHLSRWGAKKRVEYVGRNERVKTKLYNSSSLSIVDFDVTFVSPGKPPLQSQHVMSLDHYHL